MLFFKLLTRYVALNNLRKDIERLKAFWVKLVDAYENTGELGPLSLAHGQQFLLLSQCFQFYSLIKLWLSLFLPQHCHCHLLQVWCMLERVKFSPLPDVNDLTSVTNLNTLLECCNCSKMKNFFLSNNIFTLNPYLLCWFLTCKTWNSISLLLISTSVNNWLYTSSSSCIYEICRLTIWIVKDMIRPWKWSASQSHLCWSTSSSFFTPVFLKQNVL